MEADAWGWIVAREPEIPEQLRRHLRLSLEQVHGDGLDIPTCLVRAATHCLRRALALGDDRSAALDLLAADAFLTLGAEAAAERGSEVLKDFASSCSAEALDRLATERTS